MILANGGLTQPEHIDLTRLGVVKLYCLIDIETALPARAYQQERLNRLAA